MRVYEFLMCSPQYNYSHKRGRPGTKRLGIAKAYPQKIFKMVKDLVPQYHWQFYSCHCSGSLIMHRNTCRPCYVSKKLITAVSRSSDLFRGQVMISTMPTLCRALITCTILCPTTFLIKTVTILTYTVLTLVVAGYCE